MYNPKIITMGLFANLETRNSLNGISSITLEEIKKEKPMTPRNLEDRLMENDIIALPKEIGDSTFRVQTIGTGKAVVMPVMVYRGTSWRALNFYPTAFCKMVNLAEQDANEQWADVGNYVQPKGSAAVAAQNSVNLYEFFDAHKGEFITVTKAHKEMAAVATKFDNGRAVEFGFKMVNWYDFDLDGANPTPDKDPYTLLKRVSGRENGF